jgi:hypothetical protein
MTIGRMAVQISVALLGGCGQDSYPPKPDLPTSVSPGWTLKNYEGAPPPEGLPDGALPLCWKGDYAGAQDGRAEVWACAYRNAGAFNAMQRMRAGANVVKFQKGSYLIVVRWSGGSRTDLMALMRTLEKDLPGN